MNNDPRITEELNTEATPAPAEAAPAPAEPEATPVAPPVPPVEESTTPETESTTESGVRFSSAPASTFTPYGTTFVPPQDPLPKKNRNGLKIFAFLLSTVAILAVGVFGGFWLKSVTTPSNDQPSKLPPLQTEEEADTDSSTDTVVPPADKDPVFTPDTEKTETLNAKEIYASNVNSIVGITVEGEVYNIFGSISAYASSGTGFILNENGYILTNYHVIDGDSSVKAPKITVSLYNGQTYEAKVIGYDQFSDVALIKIEAEGLSPVSLGDSDHLVAGESVAVIGHPLGELTYSISKGIVAAVNRKIAVENKQLEMFQIDAAVNSGNSGGPAFNEKGQVVGIVTRKYTSSSIEGLGFCIPINTAVKIANDLINYGFIRGQAGLGVSVKNVYSGSGYYQQNFGVQVQSVNPGSSAEKAGIQKNDILIGIDDTRITSTTDLNAVKSNYKMGDTATLTLYRDGEEIKVEVTFEEFIPEEFSQAPSVA